MIDKVFCGAPFYSVYIGPEGQFSPCCLYDTLSPAGFVRNKEDILQQYNSKEMVNLRKDLMMGGKPPKCFNCWRYEKQGIKSYRDYFNTKLYDEKTIQETVFNDFKIDEIKIRHFDIRFSNKCNLKCRTCNSNFSTSWYSDEKKLGIRNWNKPKLKQVENPESVLDFVFEQLPNVQEIYFAGGEPLMMDEHYRILDRIIEIGRAEEIKIIYSTNFSKLTYGKWDVIQQWKKFKEVDLLASLDGSYERAEYIRKNIIWSEVIKNIERLKTECSHVNFTLGICVSIMNAYNFVDLYKEWVELGYLYPENISLNILDKPDHFRISNLPDNHKRKLTEFYNSHIEWAVSKFGGRSENIKRELENVIKFLKQPPKVGWEKDFLTSEMPIDKIRDENFFDVFIEYEDLKDIILGE